jgi:hypothetical protein
MMINPRDDVLEKKIARVARAEQLSDGTEPTTAAQPLRPPTT